ncbi:hypothetical protein THAOC_11297, partial [Thalassiosira oceanica]
ESSGRKTDEFAKAEGFDSREIRSFLSSRPRLCNFHFLILSFVGHGMCVTLLSVKGSSILIPMYHGKALCVRIAWRQERSPPIPTPNRMQCDLSRVDQPTQ